MRTLSLMSTGGFVADININIQRDATSISQYHAHRFVEIVYFYHGTGVHKINDEEFVVKSGDIFVLNAGVSHMFKGDELRVVNVMFSAEFILPDYSSDDFINQFYKKHFETADEKTFSKGYIYVPNFSSKYSDTIVYNMLQEFNSRKDCFADVLRNEIEVLMINLLRLSTLKQGNSTLVFSHKNLLEKAILLIDENADKINSIEDIMEKIGYNKLYFNRLFKNYTGISISKYVRKKKIEKVVNLLTHTNYTIEKIAEMVGYLDVKSFYCAFKKEMNMSPGAYRAKLLSENKK